MKTKDRIIVSYRIATDKTERVYTAHTPEEIAPIRRNPDLFIVVDEKPLFRQRETKGAYALC